MVNSWVCFIAQVASTAGFQIFCTSILKTKKLYLSLSLIFVYLSPLFVSHKKTWGCKCWVWGLVHITHASIMWMDPSSLCVCFLFVDFNWNLNQMTKLRWVLFRRKKSSFYNIVLAKRKSKQEGFWARKLMFATDVAKDAEKWVLLSGMHQSMTENWNLQLFIFGCYLCVAKSWMPWLHLPPSPKPQKPQPNRHVPSHPSKTVLLFEVTVPLVVGRSLVYLFI